MGSADALNVVTFVGAVLGVVAIGSACWVWIKSHEFGLGGTVLSFIGLMLLGLSIWHSVQFGVNQQGLQFKAEAYQQRAAAAAKAANDFAAQAKVAARKGDMESALKLSQKSADLSRFAAESANCAHIVQTPQSNSAATKQAYQKCLNPSPQLLEALGRERRLRGS